MLLYDKPIDLLPLRWYQVAIDSKEVVEEKGIAECTYRYTFFFMYLTIYYECHLSLNEYHP